MDESPRRARRIARWAFRTAVALILLAIALAAAIHTSPVRRYALRRAIGVLDTRYHLRVEASGLQYNLFALRLTLRDVRVAADSTPDAPFFAAASVAVRLPRSAVLGPFAIESIAVQDGRVRIVRDRGGGTNLPAADRTGQDGEGEPEPLRLGLVTAANLSVEVVDRASASSVLLPAIELTLSADGGRIDLRKPGLIARGNVKTTIERLQGGTRFDGRRLTVSGLELRTGELTARVDGAIALLAAEPSIDLRIAATADVERAARLAEMNEAPRGMLRLHATATGPFTSPTAAVTFESDRLQWRDVEIRDLNGSARLTPEHVQIERVEAQVAEGRIEGRAVVPLTGEALTVDLSWRGVQLEAVASMAGLDRSSPQPAGRTSGSLTAHGPMSEPRRWEAAARIDAAGGTASRTRIPLTGRIEAIVTRGRWGIATPAPLSIDGLPVRATLGGLLDFDARDRSTVSGLVELLPTALTRLVRTLRHAGLSVPVNADLEGRVEGKVTVRGRFGRPIVSVQGGADVEEIASLAPDTALGGPAHLTVESDLRAARVKVSVPELLTVGDATVSLEAPHNTKAEITAAGLSLERALRGIETPVPTTGTVDATITVSGPLDRWQEGRAGIQVDSFDATLGRLPVRLAVPARASISDLAVDIAALEIIAGETRLSVEGRLPIHEGTAQVPDAGALRATATGDLAQFLNAVAATGIVRLPDVTGTGPAALLARITGSAERPRVSADLELGPGTLRSGDLPPATNVMLRLHSDGTWVDVRNLGAEWQGSRIEATGRAPIALAGAVSGAGRAGLASVDARVTSITPKVLAPFVEPDTLADVQGSIDATLHVESPSLELNDVAGELRLDRMEVRVADLPIAQREPTRISIRDGFARVESWQWTGQGASVGVQGQVRLSDRHAALIADGQFDLRVLTPFIRSSGMSVAGTLEPKLSITGPLDDVRIDGAAALTGAEVRLRDPRIVATALEGRIVLTRSGARLASLSGSINGGSLQATGAVAYEPGQPTDASLDLDVAAMALEFPEGLRSELDADLGITFHLPESENAEPSGRVSGVVTVRRSAYREPLAVVTGLLAALRTRRLAAGTAAEPSLVDAFALDVRVVTDENIVVDNNVGRLELGADLRVNGTAAAPALSGRAQLQEGGQLFLGRNRYEIDAGTLDFSNPVALDPDVSLTATTRSGGEDIELTIKGPVSAPDVTLRSTSDPSLAQADIVSLLLTGRKLSDVSGNEADIIREQALAYLSGDVFGFASRAVGLDAIRLGALDEATRSADPSTIASEIDPTARLTFMKAIGRDFDVTFSQSLRNGDDQTWIVDYRPRRQLELRFISDDETLRSYELRHDVSFGESTLAGAAPRARRQQERVSTVTVTGAAAVGEDRVRDTLRLGPGDEFGFSGWQRDRDRIEALLHDAGFFEARVSARRAGEGAVALTYAIVEGPPTAIETSGYALDGETMGVIRRAWIDTVFDDFLEDEVEGIVRARLARDGYLRPVTEAGIGVSGGTKTLTIRIDPGLRATARHVRFDGVDGALADALKEWAAARRAGEQATEDPGGFARTVTAWLRARGRMRANVSVGAPVVTGSDAIVPVAVDAGPAFSIRAVRVDGARALGEEDLAATISLRAGEPFDPSLVDAARDRLQARYRREGFTAARVDVRPSIDESGHGVAIPFVVTEGPRQVIREVAIEGNRAIDPDVIARTLDLPVGEPVTAGDWLQARRRLFGTGLFRRADVTPEPLAAPQGAEQPMRARVTVQEWPALRLRYGFQVAEEHPEGEVEGRELVPGLSADLTRRTLFGRAITVGAAVDFQRRERRGRGFLTAPTLFGRAIESSFVAERARQDFTAVTLVTDVTSVSWEQRVRPRRDLRLSYAYKFERNRTFDSVADPDDPLAFDLTVKVAALNTTAAWDTRDDGADPTRGWLVSSSFDYAPRALGTEFRFIRSLTQAYYFKPWGRAVFASAARVGLAAPLGGQDLIFSERFFAGGSRTVRGVEDEGLGPRGGLSDPVGGESLLVLNQEVRVPIYRSVHGVGFLDAGNVFADTRGIDLGDLVTAYGVGLRFATPFALFRVDYGRLFSPAPDDRSARWFFGIGHAF